MPIDALATMSGEEMIALSKQHTLFEWSAQSRVDPIPVARAKGIYFWTPEGKRFIDFNSQLMCVNVGHGDERVIRAIEKQLLTPRCITEAELREAFAIIDLGLEITDKAVQS